VSTAAAAVPGGGRGNSPLAGAWLPAAAPSASVSCHGGSPPPQVPSSSAGLVGTAIAAQLAFSAAAALRGGVATLA